MELRPLARRDLGLLIPYYSNPSAVWHEEMLRLQDEDQAVYLVAWAGERPVGIAVVAWGEHEVSSHARREGCAELRTIEALDAYRRKGIGTALLKAGENAASARGSAKVGLQVGFDNIGARAFYERLGYQEAGHGLFREEVVSELEQGKSGVCQYLIKTLKL